MAAAGKVLAATVAEDTLHLVPIAAGAARHWTSKLEAVKNKVDLENIV